MVSRNHEIIHINNNEKNEVVFTKDIEAKIRGIRVKAKGLEFRINFLVPNLRRLVQVVDGALEVTNEGFGTREYIAKWLMEVYNLQDFAIEEGALDIQVEKRPCIVSSKRNKQLHRGPFHNGVVL